MKVAYILATPLASTTKLATMILPQLEDGNHGADVAGIFFFDDNLFVCGQETRSAKGFQQSQERKMFCSWAATSVLFEGISLTGHSTSVEAEK